MPTVSGRPFFYTSRIENFLISLYTASIETRTAFGDKHTRHMKRRKHIMANLTLWDTMKDGVEKLYYKCPMNNA